MIANEFLPLRYRADGMVGVVGRKPSASARGET